jgi:cytochrome c oxidase cbb3-type subunit 3
MRITAIFFSALLCVYASPVQSTQAEQGKAIFRSNCAFCHGLTGTGGRGPNLVGLQRSDDDIKKVIRDGVPGSTMPAFSGFEQDDLNNLVKFIRDLSAGVSSDKVTGDPVAGRAVYDRAGCAGCHQIGGQGSTFGPDLTRVGGGRSLKYIRDSIVDPSADVPESYKGVTVVTKDGKRISGIRMNEDTFTVQLRLPSEQFRSLLKEDAKEVREETKSLMPPYNNLSADDLTNLIAYLASLRGESAKGATTKQAEGIH